MIRIFSIILILAYCFSIFFGDDDNPNVEPENIEQIVSGEVLEVRNQTNEKPIIKKKELAKKLIKPDLTAKNQVSKAPAIDKSQINKETKKVVKPTNTYPKITQLSFNPFQKIKTPKVNKEKAEVIAEEEQANKFAFAPRSLTLKPKYELIQTETKQKVRIVFKPSLATKRIKLFNNKTYERLNLIFWQNGNYVPSALRKINWFFRDHRANLKTRIDPRLLSAIHKLAKKFRFNEYIEIVSGYRSTKTNNYLRSIGRNVARKSMHTHGKAIDFIFDGVNLRKLRDAAINLNLGGVGYYPGDGFIHIDTGDIRQW